MKRLTYSPRVAAYIRTDDGIVDVSSYIVNGSVNRVVNEVSTAQITIRNPDKRFTKEGEPTFRPMDAITIFGSRFRERPVQLFTGYLDETPYLQLYPGTCTIQASCTLKRLMYTYFDPGLPYTLNFLSQYGWVPDPQTGQVVNPVAMTAGQATAKKGQGSQQKGDQTFQQYRDGSIGNLLYATLNTIGGWDPGEIKIEEFPEDAIKTVRTILATMRDDEETAQQELDTFLKKLIGPYGGGAGTIPTGSGGTGGTPTGPGGTLTGQFTSGQIAFGSEFAACSGFSLKVIGAWMLCEESGGAAQSYQASNNNDWLNILTMPGSAKSDPIKAAQYSCNFIKGTTNPVASSTIQSLQSAGNKSDQEQISAIGSSGWGTSGSCISSVYPSVNVK